MTLEELAVRSEQWFKKHFPESDTMTARRLGVILGVQIGHCCELMKRIRQGDEYDEDHLAREIAEAVICAEFLMSKIDRKLETYITAKLET